MKSRIPYLFGFTLALALFATLANAEDMNACFAGAAKKYGINQELLETIARHESSLNPSAVHLNSDGTYDIGIMQINTRHLKVLERAGFTKADLYDPCTNIYLGAMYLHKFINKHGATWRAVGAYNAGSRKDNEDKRKAYANRIRYELAKNER